MSPDTKLIASLVNRILVRLPSNSGKKLDALENDPLVNQTVTALIELSKFRLPTITITLLNLLDSIKVNKRVKIIKSYSYPFLFI